MISISDDNEILVACGDDDSVHIYKKNAGNLYSLNYSLSDFSHVNVAQITGDGKWLLVIDEDSATGNVFSQNSIGRFELYQNISTSGD